VRAFEHSRVPFEVQTVCLLQGFDGPVPVRLPESSTVYTSCLDINLERAEVTGDSRMRWVWVTRLEMKLCRGERVRAPMMKGDAGPRISRDDVTGLESDFRPYSYHRLKTHNMIRPWSLEPYAAYAHN
jgi:hypothetical protein